MSSVKEKERRGFETEVKQLLHLMIHALYSNKEIFLRELISNASDAIDKLRFEAISHPDYYEGHTDLNIHIEYDKTAKTITIRDNGIGMSREEVISHLGTIAKSGTQAFLTALTGEEAKDRHLIGQFGVGFYSSFIVADKVTVNTRRAGTIAQEGVSWESQGEGDYTVETIEKAERGTEVILHLKASEEEFLHPFRLQHIITKYADHLNVPVLMKIEENAEKAEVINRATALWVLPKNDIQDQDYIEFYKHVAHDFEDPLLWSHNRVEGKLEYIMLLYIPSRGACYLWQPKKPRGLKLYVKRVFIMDEAEQFLPNYLRFVRGVIDSSDLPLNVSREILQSNRVVDAIRTAIIKRVLSMLSDLASSDSEKYQSFWKEFGQVLKEGPAEDLANKEVIAKLLRFASTHSDEEAQVVSLDDYIARMKPEQDKIYYVAADSFNAARNSPHLEIFREKGIEVLLLHDRIDEWLMSHLTQYENKHFQSVAVGTLEGVVNEKEKEKEKAQTEDFENILVKVKEVLGKKVKEVRLTHRLTTSPACVVAEEGQMTTQMQRLLRSAGQTVSVEPILELNPEHLLIQQLKKETDPTCFSDLSNVLFDQAILAEGGQLDDPATFIKRFNTLLLNMAKNGSPPS